MKPGDIVRVSERHHHYGGQIGVVMIDMYNKGTMFKVLFSDGKIVCKSVKNLEILNENIEGG